MRGGSFGGRAEANQEANAKAHRIEFTPRAGWPLSRMRTLERRDYLRTPELSGAAPIVGAPGAGVPLTPGPVLVLLQVGTAFVVPTDGQ